MDFLRSPDHLSAITTFAENNEKFQSAVYEAKDHLHDLLDELDWDAFTLRIRHEEGYATYKALVEGHGFHSETAERQKRLQQARKAAKERASDTRKRDKTFLRSPPTDYRSKQPRQAPPCRRLATTRRAQPPITAEGSEPPEHASNAAGRATSPVIAQGNSNPVLTLSPPPGEEKGPKAPWLATAPATGCQDQLCRPPLKTADRGPPPRRLRPL